LRIVNTELSKPPDPLLNVFNLFPFSSRSTILDSVFPLYVMKLPPTIKLFGRIVGVGVGVNVGPFVTVGVGVGVKVAVGRSVGVEVGENVGVTVGVGVIVGVGVMVGVGAGSFGVVTAA
jgi:hypothetical protein